MPSNTFLNPEGTTTVVIACDAPIEGTSRYGAYKAYRVRTEDGHEHMFFPGARIEEQLQEKPLARGTELEIRGSRAQSRDGRPYARYEIVNMRQVTGEVATSTTRAARDDGDTRMLRCVALKAAAATRGITGEPPEVLSTANAYFDWLTRP
jgi:hypothetical protein